MAVVVCQVVVGVALFSDDPPEQTTVVVHPLPNQNRLSGEVGALRNVAERDGAKLIILVVDPCAVNATGKVVDDQGTDIGRRGVLWPCRSIPPKAVDNLALALAAVDTDLAIAMTGVALSQYPGKGATEDADKEKSPAVLGGESPRIEIVVDRGGVPSVTAAQSQTTRVIDVAGTVLRPANTEGGPGPTLSVWAAGLVLLLGALAWYLATTAPRRRPPLTAPLRPNGRPQDDATVALGPARARGSHVPAPARDSVPADMVEFFRHQVPQERQPLREPQCPRCGSFDAHRATSAAKSARTHYQCGYCGFDWTVMSGAPWPNVVINPRTGR